ncbi:MAG: UDP-2,3-diacylglucosamine diphosphatase LpxI [Desulfofustis sp.]|nr:UDP-2,3-diacylglucosamine diphosphatase LpxI [Desulfofustis sp.]MBT8346056.1 UDP-2,3-diacylglucosamine diphosphatase LpxI [Desulfofustis sp.]NNF46146.1 UDP-2,3-diacylglucosamine diphosphatase LpxI [Desulfofustis sp.]NNK15096.1 UDP-2,3-diacylglucosamine diphosphatase LpxI [Desulfofustis sp.]NNK56759.1 UDP-2,3-diacylglucosamine diphosphatase LpxI [Desulfofustis sp.]
MKGDRIGIIAGGGQFPLLFIEAARKAGRKIFVAAHRSETDELVAQAADEACWVKLGQLGKIIKFFKQNGVGETVFLGTITKTQIFRDVLPDIKGLTLWNKIDVKQDDAILRAVAEALEDDGITVLESTLYLEHLLFPKGVLTRKKPNKAQRRDIEFGWRNARAIGELDIGQCVVVRDCSVMAVEAIEGTDATILRGGALAKEQSVVVKLRKPNQDFRFDLPATGANTVQTIHQVKGAVLAVEAGQSLLFDRAQMVEAADRSGIVVVGVEELVDGSLDY